MEGKPADMEAVEETESAVYERGVETKQEAEADQESLCVATFTGVQV